MYLNDLLDLSLVDQRRTMQLLSLVEKNESANKMPLVEHERLTRHNDGLKIKLPIPKNEHSRQAPYYTECKL